MSVESVVTQPQFLIQYGYFNCNLGALARRRLQKKVTVHPAHSFSHVHDAETGA